MVGILDGRFAAGRGAARAGGGRLVGCLFPRRQLEYLAIMRAGQASVEPLKQVRSCPHGGYAFPVNGRERRAANQDPASGIALAFCLSLACEEQVELAPAFAQELTEDERLPYTLAIHAGVDSVGQEHNPHTHLMISERENDGIERTREMWFRRANRDNPERGGTPKSRTFHGRGWIEHARKRSATNAKIEARGRDERVNHRSYERQGIESRPR